MTGVVDSSGIPLPLLAELLAELSTYQTVTTLRTMTTTTRTRSTGIDPKLGHFLMPNSVAPFLGRDCPFIISKLARVNIEATIRQSLTPFYLLQRRVGSQGSIHHILRAVLDRQENDHHSVGKPQMSHSLVSVPNPLAQLSPASTPNLF